MPVRRAARFIRHGTPAAVVLACASPAVLLACVSTVLLACVPVSDSAPPGDGPFYAGRTLEIIVPFGPGGGSDTWTRMMAPHLRRHLGERAAVQVINIPGGQSIPGANEFALRRRADGRTALVSGGSTFFLYLLGNPAVRFDFRYFAPVLASPVGGVVFVSPELGRDGLAGLRGRPAPLIYGGISASGNDLMPLIAFELLGIDVRPILGYESKGATRIAFERGETHIEYQTMPAYLANVVPLVDAGRAVPLFSFGILDDAGRLVPDPEVPDLPTVADVYRQLHGREPAGVEWDAFRAVVAIGTSMQKVLWLHGRSPPDAIAELTEAVARMVEDPAFLEAAALEVGAYPFYVGEAAERLFREAVSVSPEAMRWIEEFIETRLEARFR